MMMVLVVTAGERGELTMILKRWAAAVLLLLLNLMLTRAQARRAAVVRVVL